MDNQNFDDLARELSVLSCELARICYTKETHFARSFSITPVEFKFLRLFTDRDSIPIKELTSEMDITPGRITHILTSLEQKGFIVRKVDSSDRRNVIVHLTNKSKPFINNIDQSHVDLHRKILENIDSQNRKVVIEASKLLIEAVKLWSENK